MRKEFYYVLVLAEILVKHEFHLELFWTEFTMLEGVGFVYEFDCDYGCGCVQRDGFSDTMVLLGAFFHIFG